MPDPRTEVPVEPATYSVAQIAQRLSISERQVHRMRDSGALPQPIRLGRLLRFNRDLIEGWIAEGCPAQRRAGR